MAIFQAMIQALYLELWLLLVLISVHHRYPTVRRQVVMLLFHPLITLSTSNDHYATLIPLKGASLALRRSSNLSTARY